MTRDEVGELLEQQQVQIRQNDAMDSRTGTRSRTPGTTAINTVMSSRGFLKTENCVSGAKRKPCVDISIMVNGAITGR